MNKKGMPPMAFTTRSTVGKLLQLTNDIVIANGNDMTVGRALWDTGASGSCISKDIVSKLKLIPTGMCTVKTPSGIADVYTYLVNIVLPNSVLIKDVRVMESEIGNQGLGALIGMDIITLGDFALSNKDGKTTFSFQIPSQTEIDFVEEIKKHNKS